MRKEVERLKKLKEQKELPNQLYAKILKSKEYTMLSIDINNPIIENFYEKECNSDKDKFIKNIINYIEHYKIKESLKRGLEEVELQKSGKIEKRELKDILDDI